MLRTLPATSQSATYSAANIASDFGTPPATLHVAIYQLSDVVGRGFDWIDTLGVA